MRLAGRKYFDVCGYFTNGSNWLQLRPPVFVIRWTRSQAYPPHHIPRYETGASLPSIKTLVKITKILKKPATKYFTKMH